MTGAEYLEVEEPILRFLQAMGYHYKPGCEIGEFRNNFTEPLLIKRIQNKIKEFNNWISDDNLSLVINDLSSAYYDSLIQVNQTIWQKLTRDFGIYVNQDLNDGQGPTNQKVKVFDWNIPSKNDFLCVNQFQLKNRKDKIAFIDVVIFVNGIPLVVIECKSPKIPDPESSAISDLRAYQADFPEIFFYNHLLIGAWGFNAVFGTVLASKNSFKEWKDPYPLSIDELGRFMRENNLSPTSEPNGQDILLYGLLSPENLLDHFRNFTVFQTSYDKVVKKVARYHQYRAVNNIVQRLIHGETTGGLIWHTQGSGKSLLMLFSAIKLRREARLRNPLLVFATDRRSLIEQLAGTFKACEFSNPEIAQNWQHLIELIKKGPGVTVFSTMQKFKVRNSSQGSITARNTILEVNAAFKDINTNDNIIVLLDEAHRSQYQDFAAVMRLSMPNAFYVGFTGTPLARNEKNQLLNVGQGLSALKFQGFIDRYSIQQAVEDGSTVPIKYTSRLSKHFIANQNLDQLFEDYFSDYSTEQKARIKSMFNSESLLMQASERIKAVCDDVICHFQRNINPNGFKAQVVVSSRILTKRYKYYLDNAIESINEPWQTAIIVSEKATKDKSVTDEDIDDISRIDEEPDLGLSEDERNIQWNTSDHDQRITVDNFLDPRTDLKILIVCDMLLTGFDAPIEQVLYLDKKLKEHSLLQAIARVNRTYPKKQYGLIVDYYGISNNLEEALRIFDSADIGEVMRDVEKEIDNLEEAHIAVMNFIKDFERRNLEKIIQHLLSGDLYIPFLEKFKIFSHSLDIVLPDPRGLKYKDDLLLLQQIVRIINRRLRRKQEDLDDGVTNKIKMFINQNIGAEQTTELIAPIEILDGSFFQVVKDYELPESQASEMEHALSYHLNVRHGDDPKYYGSIQAMLNQIINDYTSQRISLTEKILNLRSLITKVRDKPQEAESIGLNESEFAFYNLFKEYFHKLCLINEQRMVEITKGLLNSVQAITKIRDWHKKPGFDRKLRKNIKDFIQNQLEDCYDQLSDTSLDNFLKGTIDLLKRQK